MKKLVYKSLAMTTIFTILLTSTTWSNNLLHKAYRIAKYKKPEINTYFAKKRQEQVLFWGKAQELVGEYSATNFMKIEREVINGKKFSYYGRM